MREAPPFDGFIQVPGPNPILVSGDPGAWDENLIEACDVLKDQETYYLYYHGTPADPDKFPHQGYRLGVATAPHPLGPWTKHPDNPVLDLGPEGAWDDASVACASILKEGTETFYLFYSGHHQAQGAGHWGIGLVTGPSPAGPWTRYQGNPLMEDFGYVGAAFKHEGRYWLYTEHPIGSAEAGGGPDYGPISLAHAERPEGPWTPYEGNPVLPTGGAVAAGSDRLRSQGEWGAWDDGGYSEAEVTLRDGVFHIFYGAASLHPTRIRSQESVGYAYSRDGVNFTKSPRNPVAMRERDPGAAAFAEVHHLFEPPLIYLFHTLRYVPGFRESLEDLGVQVLATQSPFCIPMPVLSLAELGPGECSSLHVCPTVSLEHIRSCALTAECTFGSTEGKPSARSGLRTPEDGIGGLEARPTGGSETGSGPAHRLPPAGAAGLRLHVRSSADPAGRDYDTVDLAAFDLAPDAGGPCRQSFDLDCAVRFVKVMVENLDASRPVRDLKVTATLKG